MSSKLEMTMLFNKWLSVEHGVEVVKEISTHKINCSIDVIKYISGLFILGADNGDLYVVNEKSGQYSVKNIGSSICNVEHFPGSSFVLVSTNNNSLHRVNVINLNSSEVRMSHFSKEPVTLMAPGVINKSPVIFITTPTQIATVNLAGNVINHRKLLYKFPTTMKSLRDVVVVYYKDKLISEDLEKETLIRFGMTGYTHSIVDMDYTSGSLLFEGPMGLTVRPNQESTNLFFITSENVVDAKLFTQEKVVVCNHGNSIGFYDIYFEKRYRSIKNDKIINTYGFSNNTMLIGFDCGFTLFKL